MRGTTISRLSTRLMVMNDYETINISLRSIASVCWKFIIGEGVRKELHILIWNVQNVSRHKFLYFMPSKYSPWLVVSYWRKNGHRIPVNRLVGLSPPRKSVVRLTDRPAMTMAVNRGRSVTTQEQQQFPMTRNVQFQSMIPLPECFTVRWFRYTTSKVLVYGRPMRLSGQISPCKVFNFWKRKKSQGARSGE